MASVKDYKTQSSASSPLLVVGVDIGASNTGLSISYSSKAAAPLGAAASVAAATLEGLQISTFPPLPFPATAENIMKTEAMTAWRQQSGKVPTKVALDATSLKLVAFGNAAETFWSQELQNERLEKPHAIKYRVFDHIKAVLDFANTEAKKQALAAKKPLREMVFVSDRRDQPLSATVLLTTIFSHLRDSALARLPQASTKMPIRWVITLPACWDEAAKQFMLEAAEKAGLTTSLDTGFPNGTVLALESETAAVAFHHQVLHTQKRVFTKGIKGAAAAAAAAAGDAKDKVPLTILTRERYLKPGTSCLMVDAGGHTFDCTVHEVDATDGKLIKASHSAGTWGGRLWNREFDKMMDRTFGGDWMGLYVFEYPDDAFALAESIEALKREIDPDQNESNSYRLELPHSFVSHTLLSEFVHDKAVITLDTDPLGSRHLASPAQRSQQLVEDAKHTPAAASGEESGDDNEWNSDIRPMASPTKLQVRKWLSTDKLPADGKMLCYEHGALLVSQRLVLSMFDGPMQHIQTHVAKLCEAHSNLSTVILAGGFCQSAVVRRTIEKVVEHQNLVRRRACAVQKKTESPSDDNILVLPVENPLTAVLVGAGLYGLNTEIIRNRVMRQALGTNIALPWDDSTHHTANGCFRRPRSFRNKHGILVKDAQCFNHFQRFMTVGELVGVNDVYLQTFAPSEAGQREMTFNLYSTTDAKVDRVDNPQCCLIGQMTLPMPFGDGGLTRQVELRLAYGGTVLKALAVDLTSNVEVHAKFSFLD